MGEWKVKPLSDLAILYNDSWKVGDEKCPYIALEHIEEGKLRLNGIGHSDIVTSNKYRFSENHFLFGKLRPYFRKVVRPQFSGICSTDIWVVGDRGETDLIFLFYLFANQDFVDLAYSGSSGTKMPRADWKYMKDTVWLIPSDIEEQKAIASVLSSFDNKIDLLHQQNKTLEAMAETLFRQWFVEEAQEDWEENSLLEVIQLIGGGTPKTEIAEYWDGGIPWLAGGDIASNHKSFISYSAKNITEVGLNNSSAKLLPKYATVITARGTVGKYCLLAQPMAFSQSNYGILPNFSECYFFTYLLVNHVVEELQSAVYGSVFDTITTTTFKEIKILLPSDIVILRFEQTVSLYFEKMFLNKSQISTLEKLRDTLLPKLISGEVGVVV